MREIKFRAWYREDKYWLTVTTLDFMKNADGSLPILCDGYKENGEHMRFGLHEVDLCQYTGLKDKNGKEIYEGDVVVYVEDVIVETIEGHHRYEPEGQIGSVEFGNGAFYVAGGEFYSHGEQMFLWSELEIIGNIYENPDLLTN